jgi:GNAT superfamily N-acetyltransferase
MTNATILTDASTEQQIAAVMGNLEALFCAMVEVLPQGELYESDTLCRHLTFPHNPMFKGVWRTRLTPGEVDQAIDETIAWFRARQAPFFFWWTADGTRPADLGDRLKARGLISMEEQQKQFAPGIIQTAAGAPCMLADLQRMNETTLSQTPPGFTIEEIHTEKALYEFKQVFVEANSLPEWAGQAWVDATLRVGIGRTPWKMYLGRLEGAPVATNMLFNGAGVASVYAVATTAAARGKGIGGAITLQPLLEARQMGYRYAVLFATEMGVHAYERIGFQLTPGRINRYLWRNE